MHRLSPLDPCSFSRPEDVIVRKIHLVLNIDFKTKILSGSIELNVEKIKFEEKQLILDVKALNILSIIDKESNIPLNYCISDTIPEFGSKLTVHLPEDKTNSVIKITYETGPDASGLQWTNPEQTAGKIHPFLYSQFQPIHARSVFPCQDTPYVKTPYTAEITSPSDLRVLMSALRGTIEIGDDKKTTYHFYQNVPVPSSLFCIVCGSLESRRLSHRTEVWAEKELIEKAAYEFVDTEEHLKIAEEICGPYQWGIYDLLILPPSYPLGGMENPCLTYITPTLLPGDRSLVNVIAHEVAHSWSGNSTTNSNFQHYWLNEGFTMFIERKILGRLSNMENEDFAAIRGVYTLQETINLYGPSNPMTALVLDLEGVHPDDAYSWVPYEKGYIFLRYLQNIVGGNENMEIFLRKYFEHFKNKSIDSMDFKHFFINHFSNGCPNISSINWDHWFYERGMPIEIPEYNSSLSKICNDLKERWNEWDPLITSVPFATDDLKTFTTLQKMAFFTDLQELDNLTLEKVKTMSSIYELQGVKNTEIRFLWLRLCLKVKWEEKIEDALDMVTEFGRMKYTRPLYRDMFSWPKARPLAIQHFLMHKKYMMHVCSYGIAKDLQLR